MTRTQVRARAYPNPPPLALIGRPSEYARACLNAGKHVVVEKPLTPTSAEAWELAQLAEKTGLVLAVCACLVSPGPGNRAECGPHLADQNRRWDSDFLTVKSLLEAGAFGELSEFEVRPTVPWLRDASREC